MRTMSARPPASDPSLLTYLDTLVGRLRGHVPAALEQFDSHAIHQARVTTRRLKAALDLMKPELSKAQRKPFARVLRQLRRRLGPLRDLDVMLGHLDDRQQDVRHAAAAAWVRAALLPQRESARAEVARHKSGRVLDRLDRWWGVRDQMLAAGEAVDGLLAASLHEQIDAFAAQATALAAASGDPARAGEARPDPHVLRITGKSLRYTLEMAAEAGHPLPKKLGKAFKRLQDSLGLWHDHVVLAERGLQEMLTARLPHHDAATSREVLALGSTALHAADRALARFHRQWSAAGGSLTQCIREQFAE